MTNSRGNIREQIKKIVHGDTPDHFMSDSMLAKPDLILAVFTTQLLALREGLPEYRHLQDCKKTTCTCLYITRNDIINQVTAQIDDLVKELQG